MAAGGAAYDRDVMQCNWIRWLLAAAAGLATGCLSGRSTAEPAPGDRLAALPILREHAAMSSPLGRAVRLVIRNDAEYARLPLVEMDVDFRREMVLLVGLGPTYTPRYGVRIRSVRGIGAVLRVETEIIPYEPAESLAPARGSPYHLVVVPWSERNVAGFETRVPAGLFSGR